MKKNKIAALTICAMTVLSATAVQNMPVLISPAEAASGTIAQAQQISVNGEVLDFWDSTLSKCIIETNGIVMVPLRAVAEKMGYTVTWDSENNAFAAEDDEWRVKAYIDEDLYYGVTKIKGAVGMTAPQSYGAAPILFEDKTFVPIKMFELFGYDSDFSGQVVSFTREGTIVDGDGREYSNNTLIISVAEGASFDAESFFRTNGLDIIYKMDNLKMYAVKLKKPMTANELEAYITKLEENKNILSVSKDYNVAADVPRLIGGGGHFGISVGVIISH